MGCAIPRRAFWSILLLPALMGAEPIVLDLWPGKAPGETGQIGEEKTVEGKPGQLKTQRITNVTKPTLTVYRPDPKKDTGAAVIVAPGGGYNILAWTHEGEEVAQWLNTQGITGIILKYRVPKRPDQVRNIPQLQDAQRAISLVRSKATEWKIDPQRIGMLGFSAGGHLTATASLEFGKRVYEPIDAVDRNSPRPDFAILVYPGGLIEKEKGTLAPEIAIAKDTPPLFFAHSSDDPVSPENSVQLYLAARKAGVPVEMHLYASGGHGFGLRPSEHPAATWPARAADWMRSRKIVP